MSKKEIIAALYAERSDYKYPDQAETASNLLDTVSSDIYSESQRFVFELIQNADDAAKNTNNEVHFEFLDGCLIVAHNGNSFTLDDIKALTSAGASTKKEDDTKTGYKGIGFKSVFGKSQRVTIFSGGFQFRFDKAQFTTILPWQIIPIWTELTDLPPEVQKSISKNNYNVSTIIELKDVDSLKKDLHDLLQNGQILLFLRRVSKISVSHNGNPIYSIEKKISSQQSEFNEITLFKDNGSISSWITKTFDKIPVPDKTRTALQKDEKTPKKLKNASFTEIIIAAKIENNKIKSLSESESLIFTYLPTKVNDFKFPFLVNGSFLTNAAREGIHEDKIWNQWLFSLIAEKLIDWIVLLTTTKYKFETLHLLPSRFNSTHNELKRSFDSSLTKHATQAKFVISSSNSVLKPSDAILDKTGLSTQPFIDSASITEFIQQEKQLTFSNDCFVHAKVEEAHKLKSVGVITFELDNFEKFFASPSFTTKHPVSDNYALIKYFKMKSDADKKGYWFQTLKTLPFIYDENRLLYNPTNGICFPTGISSTELGNIPVIHPDVFQHIQHDKPIYDWLTTLGVKEPSETAYVTNVIIPGLKRNDFITAENFLHITHYLFRLSKQNLLDEDMLESLRELKLKTKSTESAFIEAQFCYLSNKYHPQLKIEGVVKEVPIISEEYLLAHSNELEWNLFFKQIKVKDRIEVETINKNNSLPTLRLLTSETWVDESYQTAKQTPGAYGFGEHNVISDIKIPSFLNTIATNYEYAKLFWKNLIHTDDVLTVLQGKASFWYGVGYGNNAYSIRVENYFQWFLKNKACIPTSTIEILFPQDVFINEKEIKLLAADYLPVFEFDGQIPVEWLPLLPFKKRLELNDYLTLLTKIENDVSTEKQIESSTMLKKIGIIYNRLAGLLSDMTAAKKQEISLWAKQNKLLSTSGSFECVNQLKWITIEGFSTESHELKIINIPANVIKDSGQLEELFSLFQIQTIDEFIPRFENEMPENTLKTRLQEILPFYVALVEKKKMEEGENEFDRIYTILNATNFFSASEIRLSFIHNDNIIDGPSFTIHRGNDKFHFKGKWKSERTLLSLIKELANMLGIQGLNEELRFLLLETDVAEIHEWLKEQGVMLTAIKPVRPFIKPITNEFQPPIGAAADNSLEEVAEEPDDNTEPRFPERFIPTSAPTSFITTQIPVKTKTFIIPSTKAEMNYAQIQSQEVREDVGRWSEEFVYEYLKQQFEKFSEVIWVNKDGESGKPYDFEVIQNSKSHFIDVKGTPSDIKDVIYLSPNEWVFMFDRHSNYSIYRVYNAGKNARIEIIDNPAELLRQGKIYPNPITLQV